MIYKIQYGIFDKPHETGQVEVIELDGEYYNSPIENKNRNFTVLFTTYNLKKSAFVIIVLLVQARIHYSNGLKYFLSKKNKPATLILGQWCGFRIYKIL